MERLVRAGLFGKGLIRVSTPQLVQRYNNALVQLGLQPTTLDSFDIDGIGWSWQIAQEKRDNFYLCAGPSNPMGVVISPDQRGQPLYFPYNSYDRDLMDSFFEHSSQAVADITATTFLGLNIDQELTTYRDPRDLLLVNYVIVRAVAGGLFDASHHQHGLVARFSGDGLDWFDTALRSEIMESSQRWGDLRHRHSSIPDLRFEVRSFHTIALGGVFVLRCLKRDRVMLVVEDQQYLSGRKKDEDICALADETLVERLRRDGVLELDLAWFKRHPEVLAEKKEGLLADVISQQCSDVPLATLKIAQKRQYAAKFADKLPPVFHELERLMRRLEGPPEKSVEVSADLQRLLVRPHHRLPISEQNVAWLLLCRLQPGDVLRLYASDKNQFFSQYITWPEPKREWAVNLIAERYTPRMSKR